MIKAVFFDCDGVLTLNKSGWVFRWEYIAEKTGIPFDQLTACEKPFNNDMYLGRVTFAEKSEEFFACLGQRFDLQLLTDSYHATPKNDAMFDLIRSLEGVEKGIITDNTKERMAVLREKFALEDLFSLIFASGEIGCSKHHGKAVFDYVLEKSQLKPEECVFIDNSAKHLDIPKEMGFHTYYYDESKNDVEALRAWLKDLGVS